MPDQQLSGLLSSLKLSSTDVNDITTTAKRGEYQLACQKHFDLTHPGHMDIPELKVLVVVNIIY